MEGIRFAFSIDKAEEFGVIGEIGNGIVRFAAMKSHGAEVETTVDHFQRDLVERNGQDISDIIGDID